MNPGEATPNETHRYLFTLEVAPVELDKSYDELPTHLTLMSRFFSRLSPVELSLEVRSLFETSQLIVLVFDGTEELGPKKLMVHMVKNTDELKKLHKQLLLILDSLNVDYEYPEFIGDGHKPHVSSREGTWIDAGSRLIAMTACLIEVVNRKRVICSKFELSR